MNTIYEQFAQFLEEEDRERAVSFVLDKLQKKEIDVIDLYSNVLTPALNQMKCTTSEKHICIWKEHIRTAIVRTIVECCFPYVMEKRMEMNYEKRGTAVVLCPPEEYHDLGARMVADFFTICGYDAIFVGSNTPYEDFYNAIQSIRPQIVAISISNYYNLFGTKRIIEDIRQVLTHPMKIIVGGNALNENKENFKLVGADYYAASYEDIERIAGNEVVS